MELNNLRCCGVKEITGLSYTESATKAIRQFGDLTYYRQVKQYLGSGHSETVPAPMENFRYVMFTQANATGGTATYGDRFAAFIQKHKLGALIETPYNMNPNSGNNVKVWLWTVDHPRVKALLAKLRKEPVVDMAEQVIAEAAACGGPATISF